MPWKDRRMEFLKIPIISQFDLILLCLMFVGGLFYLHDIKYWSVGYIGNVPYGDAEFWWNGALHLAQGIFQDNPGKGFRPGYFLLTGLTLPVLGQQFKHFYHWFVLAFLVTSTFFYLSLRLVIGRWAAIIIVAMLIFNPFTAEWVATSTTDSTGLLLHLAALSCLLLGFHQGLHKGWFIAFGLFFAIATLTRPLMTPFIGLVCLTLLLLPQSSFKKRLFVSFCVLFAFCLPTMLWMATQKLVVDQWSLSSQDASAFYAASDPNTQVWTSTMYDHIRQLARENYHTKKANDSQIRQIFWQETIKNYLKYPEYHFKRLMPHVIEIASFSPKIATHGTDIWRQMLFNIFMVGMSLWFFLASCWWRAIWTALLTVGIYFYLSFLTPWLTLAGVLLAILSVIIRPNQSRNVAIFLITGYWLIGIAALYLVGGTWGPPLGAAFGLNALGYRLGAQVFFVSDILAVYFLWRIVCFKLDTKKTFSTPTNWWQRNFSFLLNVNRPSLWAGKLILGSFTLFLTASMIVYAIGSSIVIERAYARSHAAVISYPSLDPVIDFYRQYSRHLVTQGFSDTGGLDSASLTKMMVQKNSADVIFTGAISSFIWNLPGQERTQIKVYSQKQIYPFTMGPNSIFLEIPQHINVGKWSGRQGVFIIRYVANNHNESNLPYYLTTPALLAFIPLSVDKHHFDLSKTVWFPLVKNATQLETNSELQSQGAKIIWSNISGSEQFQRRFFLAPITQGKNSEKIKLLLNTSKIKRPSTLSFSYILGDADDITQDQKYNSMNIAIINKDSVTQKRVILNPKFSANVQSNGIKKIKFLIPGNSTSVEINFSQLPTKKGIWIYEFNLSEANFPPYHNKN